MVFDGRSKNDEDLQRWSDHQDYVLSRYGIAKDLPGRKWKMRHHVPILDFAKDLSIKQDDDYNCGPIACKVVWELMCPNEMLQKYSTGDQPSTHRMADWRRICITEMKSMLTKYENDMWLRKRKKRGREELDITNECTK